MAEKPQYHRKTQTHLTKKNKKASGYIKDPALFSQTLMSEFRLPAYFLSLPHLRTPHLAYVVIALYKMKKLGERNFKTLMEMLGSGYSVLPLRVAERIKPLLERMSSADKEKFEKCMVMDCSDTEKKHPAAFADTKNIRHTPTDDWPIGEAFSEGTTIATIPTKAEQVFLDLEGCLRRDRWVHFMAQHADVIQCLRKAGKSVRNKQWPAALVSMFQAGMFTAFMMLESRRKDVLDKRRLQRQHDDTAKETGKKRQAYTPDEYVAKLMEIHQDNRIISFCGARNKVTIALHVTPRTAKKYLPRKPPGW